MKKLIRHGDTGPEVRDVQARLLRAAELSPRGGGGRDLDLKVDGKFGTATLQAVRRFQRDRGLPADGIVGPETWRSLVEAGYVLGDRLLWYTRIMMRGDDVRELQHRLNEMGFDAGAEDGIFGPLAQAAVEEFQRNVGLDVDGVSGPGTIAALRRLRRDHQAGGVGIRAREREALRRLSVRGLVGASVLIDPAGGPEEPGPSGPSELTEAEVTWQIATRLASRLGAQGAVTILSRGPTTSPGPSERARLANEHGADLVISIAVNSLDTPTACGASAYYFGAPHFVSETGFRLAELAQTHIIAAGWRPDCRVHPMTWAILRETRMPAVVVEPGFITCPADEARLVDASEQEGIAAALTAAVQVFLGDRVVEAVPDRPRLASVAGGL